MTVKTNISPGFLWRLLLVAFACLGMMLWCIYDAEIAWPHQTMRANAYAELREKIRKEHEAKTDNKLDQSWTNTVSDKWREYAQQRGWSTEIPGKAYDENDIFMQYVMVGIVAPIGLLFGFRYLRARKRWIEAHNKGLKASWGPNVSFDEIRQIDKEKWNNKGIAKLRYEQAGRQGTLVLDDFKFEPDTTEKILRIVEKRVGFDKIVNGQPLPPESKA